MQLSTSDVRKVNRATITRADGQLYAPFRSNAVQRLFEEVHQQTRRARRVLLDHGRVVESCLSTVQRVARNVKRWHEGNQPLRWTATGLLEAEKKFRRIKGYQDLLLLKERLNPPRIQQKEVRTLEVA